MAWGLKFFKIPISMKVDAKNILVRRLLGWKVIVDVQLTANRPDQDASLSKFVCTLQVFDKETRGAMKIKPLFFWLQDSQSH